MLHWVLRDGRWWAKHDEGIAIETQLFEALEIEHGLISSPLVGFSATPKSRGTLAVVTQIRQKHPITLFEQEQRFDSKEAKSQ